MRVNAGIALSRVYRESGDLGRAIDTGERVLADLAESGLDSCDEAVQLTVTHRRRLLRTGRLGARGAHLPRRHRQGRGARVSAGPRLGVLERQRHAGPPRGHPQRCSPRGAGPGPAQRGAGHQEPGPTARRAGPPPARARPPGRGAGAAEPGEGCRGPRLEQCLAGGPGVDPARPGSGTLPRRRPCRQPRADRRGSRDVGRQRSAGRGGGEGARGADLRSRRRHGAGCPGLPGSGPPAVGHRRRSGCGTALVRPGRPARARSGRPKQRATPTSGRPRRPGCGRARPRPRARWSSPSPRAGAVPALPGLVGQGGSDQQHQMVREVCRRGARPGQPRPGR